ncbi:MAG: PQQ-dependent sugar dehydrogenase [Acidimicrobiia bacterium]
MRSRLVAVAVAAVVLAACGAGSPKLVSIGAGLSGPKGLHATVYAEGPAKVAAFAFDPQGRLWLATADDTDTGKDGLYLVAKPGARAVEVVPKLHTPLGLLWYRNTLYVASKDRVDAFSDLRGTTFETRRKILTLPANVGESNNLVLAADGTMLLGISAPCDHCIPTSKLSAAIVSFRPDGSDLRVYAGGIRAPVGLEYYPGTNDLLVTMNQRDDLGARTPGDWLALVDAGQDWKSPNCYGQGGASCTGVPQPIAVLDKHGAVAGVAIVTGQLGSTVGTSALVAEWAKDTVMRVSLDKHGTQYRGHVSTFLTGVQNPVAVILTRSGDLLVGDWADGTIYEITDPTSSP